MTQLVCIKKIKKRYGFSIVHHLESFPLCALHVTDNSPMKDVLQLTTTIVMASSAKKKNMTPNVKNI